MTGSVNRIAARLECVTENRVVDLSRWHSGPLQRFARCQGAKLHLGKVSKVSVVFGHGSPRSSQNPSFSRHSPPPDRVRNRANPRQMCMLADTCIRCKLKANSCG